MTLIRFELHLLGRGTKVTFFSRMLRQKISFLNFAVGLAYICLPHCEVLQYILTGTYVTQKLAALFFIVCGPDLGTCELASLFKYYFHVRSFFKKRKPVEYVLKCHECIRNTRQLGIFFHVLHSYTAWSLTKQIPATWTMCRLGIGLTTNQRINMESVMGRS